MGLSYTGNSCLLVTMVSGYKRVPAPPARMIPFMLASFSIFAISMFQILFYSVLPNELFSIDPSRTYML